MEQPTKHIVAYMRLEQAVTHHQRADRFKEDHDDALYASRDRILGSLAERYSAEDLAALTELALGDTGRGGDVLRRMLGLTRRSEDVLRELREERL